jgi:hypothetical protein
MGSVGGLFPLFSEVDLDTWPIPALYYFLSCFAQDNNQHGEKKLEAGETCEGWPASKIKSRESQPERLAGLAQPFELFRPLVGEPKLDL